jgi:hypothetical protein
MPRGHGMAAIALCDRRPTCRLIPAAQVDSACWLRSIRSVPGIDANLEVGAHQFDTGPEKFLGSSKSDCNKVDPVVNSGRPAPATRRAGSLTQRRRKCHR